MSVHSDTVKLLRAALAEWVEIDLDGKRRNAEWVASMGHKLPARAIQGDRALTRRMAAAARPHLAAFARSNDRLTADQLEELAADLSPGGAHTGALLGQIIERDVIFADPLLVAAVFRYNWHGGKAGFQFLPDPATTDPDDYDEAVWHLLNVFDLGTASNPRRVLTGEDLAFFDSLPDRFTVYRGAHGLSPERAAAGVCWTTRREVAEWFARRGSDDAVVITARCRKDDVRLAKATECEVVTIPSKARLIACRPHSNDWHPEMTWVSLPEQEPREAA